MKDARKSEYTKIVLDLIYFEDQISQTWANVDKKKLRETIEIIKFYRQFSDK